MTGVVASGRPEEVVTLEHAREILRVVAIPESLHHLRKHFTDKQAVKLAHIIVATSTLPFPHTHKVTAYQISKPADIQTVTTFIDQFAAPGTNVACVH